MEEECSVVPGLRELCLYTAALLAGIILKRRDAERVRAMVGRSIWQGFLWGTPGQGFSEACHGAVPPIILHSPSLPRNETRQHVKKWDLL